jgi:hypothetical protein
MEAHKGLRGLWPFIRGLAAGIVSASLLIYLLNLSGLVVVSSGNHASVVEMLNWCYGNLGLSLIPFAVTGLMYVLYLRKLGRLLDSEAPSADHISDVEEKVDLLMNIFFGIGVIWTAIGMRNALLSALGNMDAEVAAQKGAFYILTQLIDGGILVALSTTIFGGIGGYCMRLIKSWVVGARLSAYSERQYSQEKADLAQRLDRIILLLENNHHPTPLKNTGE